MACCHCKKSYEISDFLANKKSITSRHDVLGKKNPQKLTIIKGSISFFQGFRQINLGFFNDFLKNPSFICPKSLKRITTECLISWHDVLEKTIFKNSTISRKKISQKKKKHLENL